MVREAEKHADADRQRKVSGVTVHVNIQYIIMYELWGEYMVIIFSGKGKQWELGLRLCHKEILTDLSTRLSSILMT